MRASIIIAVKYWQPNLETCINRCRELDFSEFEILIFPDEAVAAPINDSRLKIIPTGKVSPPEKRDIGLTHAQGEILAFIDDDAYPRRDWLNKAMENFKDPEVAAVGGPAITPCEDNLRQQASGRVFSSLLVSGQYAYRYLPRGKRKVDDFPSCNFLIRKSVMQDLGGFKTKYWPGEDTKLCLDITKKLSKVIIYDPQVVVYHHRRALYLAHLRQVANYAFHRGYFVKKYPRTSFRIAYFVPSILLGFILAGGVLSLFFGFFRVIYFCLILSYLLSAFVFSINKDIRLIPLTFSGIILTHLAYGANFLKGILAKKLPEEKV